MSNTLEAAYMVYDDETGEVVVTVGQDPDALGLIELIQGKHTVQLTAEQAQLPVKAIERMLADLGGQGS